MNQPPESSNTDPEFGPSHPSSDQLPSWRKPTRSLANNPWHDGALHPLVTSPVESVTVMQVICVFVKRGSGMPGDGVRDVLQYWAMDGRFLAERDEINES